LYEFDERLPNEQQKQQEATSSDMTRNMEIVYPCMLEEDTREEKKNH
jgi:hypothetical protein